MTPEDDQNPGRYPLTHKPDPSLPGGFPLPAFHARDRRDFKHVGRGGWTGYWPPEDSAVPPQLEWTEAQRMLVLATYQRDWGRFLEDNETFDVTWPPRGGLWTDGHVYSAEAGDCVDHGDPQCEDCDEFEEVDGEVQPAEWQWVVTIETYAWRGNTGTVENTQDFHFLTTRMDPREVDYQWQ